MPWDTEATRRRLKEAATLEFAERGPDGATMERIAERAGINKERLYKYFGDKRALFEIVLRDELHKLAAAVPVADGKPEDIGEYAGRTFDYHTSHPELVRLLLWEALSGGWAADEATRTAIYRRKVDAAAAAQRAGVLDDQIDPAHLVFLCTSLTAWWFAVPQLAHMVTLADPADPTEQGRRRASVIRAVQRLALARPAVNHRSSPDESS